MQEAHTQQEDTTLPPLSVLLTLLVSSNIALMSPKDRVLPGQTIEASLKFPQGSILFLITNRPKNSTLKWQVGGFKTQQLT